MRVRCQHCRRAFGYRTFKSLHFLRTEHSHHECLEYRECVCGFDVFDVKEFCDHDYADAMDVLAELEAQL